MESSILIWIVVSIFLVGSVLNGIGPRPLRAQYAAWGYPSWFRYVTSILEFATAILLLFPASRVAGAALGMAILLAAAATLIRSRQYPVVIVPTIVLVLTGLIGWAAL